MKIALFIISFILSCIINSGAVSAQELYGRSSILTVEIAWPDDTGQEQNFHSNAIVHARTTRSFGKNGGYAPTFRSNNSVRRIPVSQKHPFRIIKSGKIIDGQHFFVFHTIMYPFPSGIKSICRYIHIICQLLI